MGERMHEVCVCVFACRDACVELGVKSCDLFSAALCVHTHTFAVVWHTDDIVCYVLRLLQYLLYTHTLSQFR